MVNPFSSYRYIPAEHIIKSNIRLHKMKEDLKDLLKILSCFEFLPVSDVPEGSRLDQSIIKQLTKKVELLDLLIYFGYVFEKQDKYIYQSPKSDCERDRRLNGVKEFENFYENLKYALEKSLTDLREFIRNSNRKSNFNSDNELTDDDNHRQLSSSFRSKVEEHNRDTLQIVDSLKTSLATKYNAIPSQVFILRKLALLIFKQTYPDSVETGDENILMTIEQKIHLLKHNDTERNLPHTENIYLDCLIRSNFNKYQALYMLLNDRPDFTKPMPTSVTSTSSKNSIAKLVLPLKQQWHSLQIYKHEDNSVDQFLRAGDKWRLVKHIVPTIQQLRRKKKDDSMDETILSKVHRMLFSELSNAINQQVPVKIETLASILCELSPEAIQNLDISAVKNVITFNHDIRSDDFRTAIMNILSITCPICTGIFPRSQMEAMFLCDHMCCLECVKTFYEIRIKTIEDYNSLRKLTCIVDEHKIENDQIMNFFIFLEAKLNRWFSDNLEVRKLYQEKIFHATRDTQIKKCGNPKCISYFDIDQNNSINAVRCPHCRFSQCRQCNQKWFDDHKNMTCDKYEEWMFENNPDDPYVQALNLIKETAFACPNPNCEYIYDFQPGGCEHFVCRECGTDFCRMCSSLFYSPEKVKCTQATCDPNMRLHAHCPPNCFRETRNCRMADIIKLLNDHRVNITNELNKKEPSKDNKCSLKGCGKPLLAATAHRFCEYCYILFLCTLVWHQQLEPWELYENNNLQQLLKKASVHIPANCTRTVLIELCQKHLNQSLGKPKKLRRSR